MKLFILILFITFIILMPQLYTWLVREAVGRRQEWYAFGGGVALIMALSAFLIFMMDWGIIQIAV
jgi:hypothetical protein